MKHFKPINKKSRETVQAASATAPDAFGHACAACCASFAPGWEVGPTGNVDPCPWQNDLNLCWVTCFWHYQIPDDNAYPSWMNQCGNVAMDWTALCVVPDV